MGPFQIWAKSRQTTGIAAGGIAAKNAAERSYVRHFCLQITAKKQPFADETVSQEAPHPVCLAGNRHGPPARAARFSGLFDPEIS
jgi:hypothetical protein